MQCNDKIKTLSEIFRLNVVDIDSVTESNSSQVYILTLKSEEKVVLKIPFNKKKLIRELNALKVLEGNVPVPKVLNYYMGDNDIPAALLFSYIDGEPLTENVTEEVVFQMGVFLAKIHKIQLKKYSGIVLEGEKDEFHDYINNLKKSINDNLHFCEKVMSPEKIKSCMNLFDDYFKNFPILNGPCLVHSDYRCGNILAKDSKVVGIIDFEVSQGGAADSDFPIILNELSSYSVQVTEKFLEGYKTIKKLPDIEFSLPFYEFFTAFCRIGWCVKRNKINEKYYFDFQQQIDCILDKSMIIND